MRTNLLIATVAVGVLLATAGPAPAQVYYSQGSYYYPSTGTYYYPSTTSYYYPSTGTYTYGTYPSQDVVQAGSMYYSPSSGTYSQTYGYSPYVGSTYQSYGYSPSYGYSGYSGYSPSYGYSGYSGSGPYLSVSPWGVNYGVAPLVNRSANWGRAGRWFR